MPMPKLNSDFSHKRQCDRGRPCGRCVKLDDVVDCTYALAKNGSIRKDNHEMEWWITNPGHCRKRDSHLSSNTTYRTARMGATMGY